MCRSCGLAKPEDDFGDNYNRREKKTYKRSYCKPCTNARRVRYHYYKYGLTQQDYEDLLVAQHGVCAICGKTDRNRRLNVDHDHKTGRVRALLCNYCNTALHIAEDTELLERLMKYLESKSWPS